MARQRNYQAEYAARQARSQARYGVSYNEYRKLQQQAKAGGIPAATFRKQAFIEGTVNGNLNRIKRLLGIQRQARGEHRDFSGGGLPDTAGRRRMRDLYDDWSDSFDDDRWFWYH